LAVRPPLFSPPSFPPCFFNLLSLCLQPALASPPPLHRPAFPALSVGFSSVCLCRTPPAFMHLMYPGPCYFCFFPPCLRFSRVSSPLYWFVVCGFFWPTVFSVIMEEQSFFLFPFFFSLSEFFTLHKLVHPHPPPAPPSAPLFFSLAF